MQGSNATEFEARYRDALRQARGNAFRDNYDYRRFGADVRSRIRRGLRERVKSAARRLGLHADSRSIDENVPALNALYSRLADEQSRHLLIDLLAYRTLGHRKVRLPLNQQEFWQTLERLDRSAKPVENGSLGFLDWNLSEFDLAAFGYPLRLLGVSAGVHAQLILEQYRANVDGTRRLEAQAGDVVIDGGGCYGETALYFATKNAPDGRIYSFEFLPENLAVFNRNLELNPELGKRIHIVPKALWSESDVPLAVTSKGPGTSVTPASASHAGETVDTLTIDELVRRQAISRVDLIKLDIEGAEGEALRGAESTLRSDRPKLAISVYHRLSDFWSIPAWIDSLALDYRFYLRHFTIHAEETILFGVPATRRSRDDGSSSAG